MSAIRWFHCSFSKYISPGTQFKTNYIVLENKHSKFCFSQLDKTLPFKYRIKNSLSVCSCHVWPNGWMVVYELSGSGFESSYSHLKIPYEQF